MPHRIGTGPRSVLALHCTLAHGGAWRGVAVALGQDRVCLHAPDMLSHGRSPDWDGGGDFATRMASAVTPILVQPMDVVGHSFGAVLALRLAVENPELVRSLTLIEPVFFAIAAQDDPEMLARHDHDARDFETAYATGDIATAARLFNRMWSDASLPRWPQLSPQSRASMIRGFPIVPACAPFLFGDNADLLRPGRLKAVSMPVRLITGTKSHGIIPVIANGLCARLPNADRLQIEGAGHMAPVTHPDLVARAIAEQFDRA